MNIWGLLYAKNWDIIGEFDEKEIKAFKTNDPLLWEARASARMEAYVRNVEVFTDRDMKEYIRAKRKEAKNENKD